MLIPDISEWQGQGDLAACSAWQRAQWGWAAIVFRVNYGQDYRDAMIDYNLSHADLFDAVGLYCYLRAGQAPEPQADLLVSVVQAHGGLRANWFFVCDDEEGSGDESGRVNAWLGRVEASLGANPVKGWTYSGAYFWTAHLSSAAGHRWVAAYGSPDPGNRDLWQFTDRQPIPGLGNVDCSQYDGDRAAFLRLIAAIPPIVTVGFSGSGG